MTALGSSPLHTAFAEGIDEHQDVIAAVRDGDALAATTRAAGAMIDSIAAGGKVILFGNGGSAADAMHLAAEFLGRFLVDRRPLPAIALGDNHSAITAIANDYAYQTVFSRQIEALGRDGDVALGLSTSGASPNVAEALVAARRCGMVTVAMTGSDPGVVGEAADIVIAVPTRATPHVQEAHLMLGHLMCAAVERSVLPLADPAGLAEPAELAGTAEPAEL
jgi:D-sedoheptulose 7-phosphate isomerase